LDEKKNGRMPSHKGRQGIDTPDILESDNYLSRGKIFKKAGISRAAISILWSVFIGCRPGGSRRFARSALLA
jgi:hypothetical protein